MSASMLPRQHARRGLLIATGWIQAVVIVVLCGFLILGILAYRTYTDEPPIASQVVDPAGHVLFTGADVVAGQEVFLRNGLMEYGSIFGHGAYLGPDFTADYLHRAALIATDHYGGSSSEAARQQTITDFKANRYDSVTGVLTYTEAQAEAFRKLEVYYAAFLGDPTSKSGLRPSAITNPHQIAQLTAFFSWSAWAASTLRPNLTYSYTNNWPPERLVDNHATADAIVWSVLSRSPCWAASGCCSPHLADGTSWAGTAGKTSVSPSPSRRGRLDASAAVVCLVLSGDGRPVCLQAILGGATQHYRAELADFFGFDLARILPFNIARTWHLQLAIFWVSTSFLAAGIFLAPMITGREPRGQNWLSYGLLTALVVVVVGSLAGEYAGINGWIQRGWSWFGAQGFEYLDLGRFWQILLTVGLAFWVIILFRGLRGRLRSEHVGNMPWLFLFSALSIPAFYAVGLLAQTDSHFTTTDFWRFWVVHLWVEDFLELFTTILVAYIFVLLGVVYERVALKVIYLDILLYSAGGVVGTMHHVYFSGEPSIHMALGAFFSAAEVIPLAFLTLEAWSFLQLGAQQSSHSRTPFPHFWAVMFLASVGFWNFLGAGIFGFLVNLPIVSYYEIGTALTANHAHAAMMGVYGMLAVGLALFCLRYMIPEARWSDRAAKISFWSLNIGLAWMVFATLFPVGILQLYHSVSVGYFDARSLEFLSNRTNAFLEWLRLPGDTLFILGGTVPIVYLAWLGVRHMTPRSTLEEPTDMLFTEIMESKSANA